MSQVAILGVGKLGEAIASGLLASGQIGSLTLVERSEERRADAARRFHASVTVDPIVPSKYSEKLILAVKPGDLLALCRQIAPIIRPEQLIISVAAGVRLETVRQALGGHRHVARAMPNIAAAIRSSITGVYSDEAEALADTLDLFRAVGRVLTFTDEAGIDRMTAIGASGIGFVVEFLDAMIAASEENGLQESRDIVLSVALGTLKLLDRGNEDIKDFLSRTRTPGGTTAAGLEVLDAANFRSTLRDAVQASISRAGSLDTEVQ